MSCGQKLAVISGNGLNVFSTNSGIYQEYHCDKSTVYEALFDPLGQYFCYCSNNGTIVLNLKNGEKTAINSTNKFRKICFSPKGTYMCLLSIGTNSGGASDDNIHCFRLPMGEVEHTFKGNSSGLWSPIWSTDENVAIKVLKSEVYVYASGSFERYNGKLTLKGLEKASITQANNDYYIAAYVKGSQNTPNMMKIYKYPNLSDAVNNRSFFKAHEVYFNWHPKGRSLLFLVHYEDTKSNYYGENSLYFLSCESGGETAIVSMPKDNSNSIHNVQWQPITGDKFVVTYGNPVAAAVFNNKCQFLYHIDSPNRNVCQFSNCGNLLAMVGIGNVRGSLQLWNFAANHLIGEMDVPDINRICWSGDDQFIVSATVSPSLRVNNGFIVWDVNGGRVVTDKQQNNNVIGCPAELYNVIWQPVLSCTIHEHCSNRGGMFYFDSQCQRFNEKPAVSKTLKSYVPPHLRKGAIGDQINGDGAGPRTNSGFRIQLSSDAVVPASNKPKKKRNKAKAAGAGGGQAAVNQ